MDKALVEVSLRNRSEAGERSRALFADATEVFPGGVNSPVRAFKAVGGSPLFIERGRGPFIFDVDGRRYIDYVMSYGPLILGHADLGLIAAITEVARNGTSFGAPTPHALRLASLIRSAMPSIEMIRFVNSGTEATMSALRLARAYTGRSRIVKFEGCYHGHADYLLVSAGSGVVSLGLPDSPGVPPGAARDTMVVPYNDLEAVDRVVSDAGGDIAAVIVEPVAGNMGVVPPAPGFLEGLRALTTANGALLIFDEVMTGFRVHPGGAQALYEIEPDLTALGKIIGGGLPVGAYGGRREIMEMVAPVGPVYQAGTLAANPLAMAAGIYTLESLLETGRWSQLDEMTRRLAEGIREYSLDAGRTVAVNRSGAMFSVFFCDSPVTDWNCARRCDAQTYSQFFRAMLANGIYLPPSGFEAWFPSLAHDADVVEATLSAARVALQEIGTASI